MTTDTRPHVPPRVYALVYVALLLLLGITVGIDQIPMGWGNTAVALFIATVKAALVALFFMHLHYSTGIVKVASIVGLIWLAILISFTINDYLTRVTVVGY